MFKQTEDEFDICIYEYFEISIILPNNCLTADKYINPFAILSDTVQVY